MCRISIRLLGYILKNGHRALLRVQLGMWLLSYVLSHSHSLSEECKNIILLLEYRTSRMVAKNELISGEHHRTRRSPLNFVGILQRALFGVLDDASAEMYAEDMSTIMSNQNHLSLLLL